MTGTPCTECSAGWLVTYKSRRSSDGKLMTQYRRCWLCNAAGPKLVTLAGPPKKDRCTRMVQTCRDTSGPPKLKRDNENMDTEHDDRLHTPQTIPQSFLDAHYCQEHVMHALGMDEPTFWALYVSGAIPRGVSLMALCHVPLIVWPKSLLDQWHRNGRPAEPGALELQNQVLHSLMDAFRAEGIEFPDCPPVFGAELN